MKIIDVSRPLFDGMPVYPGNPPTEITSSRRASAKSSALSVYSFGSHNGTHVDAPSHILPKGKPVDKIPLEKLSGKAVVLEFLQADSITKEMLFGVKSIRNGIIVLFKTRNSLATKNRFREDFVYLEKDAAGYLARKGVKAVGVDGPSVDRFHSGSHPAHHALLGKGIPVIEGLDLSRAPSGACQLYCFPLKVMGGDASPARAILLASPASARFLNSKLP